MGFVGEWVNVSLITPLVISHVIIQYTLDLLILQQNLLILLQQLIIYQFLIRDDGLANCGHNYS
jgi:hypothetical protein